MSFVNCGENKQRGLWRATRDKWRIENPWHRTVKRPNIQPKRKRGSDRINRMQAVKKGVNETEEVQWRFYKAFEKIVWKISWSESAASSTIRQTLDIYHLRSALSVSYQRPALLTLMQQSFCKHLSDFKTPPVSNQVNLQSIRLRPEGHTVMRILGILLPSADRRKDLLDTCQ